MAGRRGRPGSEVVFLLAVLLLGGCDREDAAAVCRQAQASGEDLSSRERAACRNACAAGDETACPDESPGAETTSEARTAPLSRPSFQAALHDALMAASVDSEEGQALCRAGSPTQCVRLGASLERNASSLADREQAFSNYAQACAPFLKDPAGCNLDVRWRRDERGRNTYASSCARRRRPGQTVEAYLTRCLADCAGEEACDALLERQCVKDPDDCARRCDTGSAPHCRVAALLQHEGRGLPENQEKAETYRLRACELGDRISCQPFDQWPNSVAAKTYPDPMPGLHQRVPRELP
jgi:hypothetical protein